MSKSISPFILFFSGFLVFSVNAQSSKDFQLASELLAPKKAQSVKSLYADNLKNDGSEIEILSTGLFYIYKEFFSSQDYNECVFHPSCSSYGIECIKTYGLLLGGAKTMDRLTRCNGLSPEKYEKDFSRKKLSDPVGQTHPR